MPAGRILFAQHVSDSCRGETDIGRSGSFGGAFLQHAQRRDIGVFVYRKSSQSVCDMRLLRGEVPSPFGPGLSGADRGRAGAWLF